MIVLSRADRMRLAVARLLIWLAKLAGPRWTTVRMLHARPGSVAVIETDHPISSAQREALGQQWARVFPDLKVVVLERMRLVAVLHTEANP